jgi:hypothetical protein
MLFVVTHFTADAPVLRAKLLFDTDHSDLLTDVNAYNKCMRLRSEGKSQSALRSFCEEVCGISPVG